MTIYKTHSEIICGIIDETLPEWWARRLIKVYHDAYKESKEHGYIGVGCVTFAEDALVEYQLNDGSPCSCN